MAKKKAASKRATEAEYGDGGAKLPVRSSDDDKLRLIVAESDNSKTEVSEQRLVALAVMLLTIGMAGFYFLPGMLQEGVEGSRVVNAFYCTVMTLTT
jgi:hypothetical protein